MPLLTKVNGKFCNTKSNVLKDIKIVKEEEEPKQNIICNTPETSTQQQTPQTQATNKSKSTTLPELSFTKKKKLKKIYFKVD